MVEKIKVVGVPGRLAFSAPRGGKRISHDAPVIVAKTDWIKARLSEGDIVEYAEPKTKTAPQAAASASSNNGA